MQHDARRSLAWPASVAAEDEGGRDYRERDGGEDSHCPSPAGGNLSFSVRA
jgi:hypothetical protein